MTLAPIRRLRIALIAAIVAFMALVWGAIAYQIDSSRDAALNTAARHGDSLASSVGAHYAAFVRMVDLWLQDLRKEWLSSPTHVTDTVMRDKAALLNVFAFELLVLDAQGRITYSSLPSSRSTTDLSSQKYFGIHRESHADRLFIGDPIPNAVGEGSVIPFSRTIRDSAGNFAGVIAFLISPQELNAVYGAIDLGEGGVLTLSKQDGAVLTRSQDAEKFSGPQSADWTGGVEGSIEKSSKGQIIRRSALDGVERLFNYRSIPDFDLVVAAGQSLDVVLADYFQQRRVYLAGGAMLTALMVWLMLLLNLRLRREEISSESLRGSEKRFRDLINLSYDTYWEQDEQYRFTVLTGTGFQNDWRTEIFRRSIGLKRWEIGYTNMTQQDWARHIADLDARKPFQDLELCIPDETGQQAWLSVNGEPIFDADGAFTGYRGVAKEITAKKRDEQLRTLEHAVSRCLAEESDLAAALTFTLRTICEIERWEYGEYWRINDALGQMQVDAIWAASDEVRRFGERSRGLTFRAGEGLGGWVWHSKQSLWFADVTEEPRFARRELALEAGLHGAVLIPVKAGEAMIGLIQFGTLRKIERDAHLLDTLEVVGGQIGQFVRRSEGEEALRRFRAAMDASAEIVLLVDQNTLRYVDVNEAACRMLGYSREELLGMTAKEVFFVSNRNFEEDYPKLVAGDFSVATVEGWLRRKDGTRFLVESTRRAVPSREGHIVIAVVRDITERRQEERLRELEHLVDKCLSEEESISAALTAVLRAIGETESWVCGEYWRLDEAAGAMRLSTAWVAPGSDDAIGAFIDRFRNIGFRRGEGLIGWVWEHAQSTWVEDAETDPRILHKDLVYSTGLRGRFTFPVIADGEVIGVLDFPAFQSHRPDKRLVEAAHAIGSQIGRYLQRKEAEEALQRFRFAMDQSADMVALIDRASMRYIDVNDTMLRQLGYSREELLRLGPQDTLSLPQAEIERVYDGLIVHPDDHSLVETYYRRKDGSKFPIESFRRALRSRDRDVIVAVARDVTDRRRREEELLRFRAAMDLSADWITLTDRASMRYVDVNKTVCDESGYTREELLQMGPQDMSHIPREELERNYDDLISGKQGSEMYETERHQKDGSVIPVEVYRRAVATERGHLIVSIVRDVSERRRREEDLRRFRAAMDLSADSIMLADRATLRYVDVNETACRDTGYTREQLLQMGPHDLTGITREEQARIYDALIAGDSSFEMQESVRHRRDGTTVPIEIYRKAVPSGNSHLIVAIVRDISERYRREEELHRFRAAMDLSADSIMLIDRASMRFVDMNETACRQTGFTREQLLRMGPHDLNGRSREEQERVYDALIAGSGEELSEHHRRKADGTIVPIEVYRRAVPSGSGYLIVAIVRDISERRRRDEELRKVNERFHILSQGTNDVIRDHDLLQDRIWWNENIETALGYGRSNLLQSGATWQAGMHPEDAERVRSRFDALLNSNGTVWQEEYRFRRGNGNYAHILDRGSVVRDKATGKAVRLISAMVDITARKEAEERIRDRELQQSVIADFGQTAMTNPDINDLMHRAVIAVTRTLNIDMCSLLELSEDQSTLFLKDGTGWEEGWIGRSVMSAKSTTAMSAVIRTRMPVLVGDFENDERFSRSELAIKHGIRSFVGVCIPRADGVFGALGVQSREPRRFSVEQVNFLQAIANTLASALERKGAEDRLVQLARFDTVTGLPNRILFRDRLEQVLAQSKRNGWLAGVMFIDLDRFKIVNDTLGHNYGDMLLVQVGQRLTQSMRDSDTVARLSGDEFAVVLPDLAKADDVGLVAQKTLEALALPFDLDGRKAYVTASIGIAVYPEDGDDANVLLKNADTAMYRAKSGGRNGYQFYMPEMNERAIERLELEADLRDALQRGEFFLHYQPKVNLRGNEVVGFEALLRWRNPRKGLISSSDFIPLLEDTGLIVPVGEWVLHEACRQIKAWESIGIVPAPIAVNLSARQFQQKNLDETVRGILSDHGVDPFLIEIEITESLLMQDAEGAAATLRALKAAGVRILIDDFGTGYSSLSYLSRFKLDSLKIDRSFIDDVVARGDDAAITLAIIHLAHSLKLNVVAEGVESQEQLDFLAANGCDMVQGYIFSRPASPEECQRMLQGSRRLRPIPVSTGSVAAVAD